MYPCLRLTPAIGLPLLALVLALVLALHAALIFLPGFLRPAANPATSATPAPLLTEVRLLDAPQTTPPGTGAESAAQTPSPASSQAPSQTLSQPQGKRPTPPQPKDLASALKPTEATSDPKTENISTASLQTNDKHRNPHPSNTDQSNADQTHSKNNSNHSSSGDNIAAASDKGTQGAGGGNRGASCAGVGRPPYPRASRERGEEGTVQLRLNITPEGRVRDARIVKSSGFERLDYAVVQALDAWRCTPAVRDGKAIVELTTQEVHFSLKDAP